MAIYLNNTTIKRGNSGIPIIYEGENLDTVLAEQEALIAEQEAMIINIQTALEGKAGVVAETCTITLNLQTGNGISPTTLSCVLADGSFIKQSDDGEWSTSVSGTYTFTLPKPCCIGLSNIISISGDYITKVTNAYLINGDVTVEGYYITEATEPA